MGLLVYCFIGLKEKPVAAQLMLPELCVFSEIQVYTTGLILESWILGFSLKSASKDAGIT